VFPDDIEHRVKVAGVEVDLLIRSAKVAVQYDGMRYHSGKAAKDRGKTQVLVVAGYQVIRVRDVSLPAVGYTLRIRERSRLAVNDVQRLLMLIRSIAFHPMQESVIERYLARNSFAAEEAYLDLCAARPGPRPGRSLQDLRPDIAALWHVEKNGHLSAARVTPQSSLKVHWKCERHEAYLGSVCGRVSGKGCPYCARRIVLPEDSIACTHPTLAAEFHPTKNEGKHPSSISSGSNQKYLWICSKHPSHEWEATVHSRVQGCGCPFCANRKIDKENSLAALEPKIASQWHYEKNFPLRPEEYCVGSHKEVWWRCEVDESHEWQAPIKNRTRLRSGCPFCNGKKTDPNRSLAALRPDLAREWHPDRNAFGPDAVLCGSGKTVCWQCTNNHEHIWLARVEVRNKGGKRCPVCYPRRWGRDP